MTERKITRLGKVAQAIVSTLVYGVLDITEAACYIPATGPVRRQVRALHDVLEEFYSPKQIENALYNLRKQGLVLNDGGYIKFNQEKIAILDQLNVMAFQPKSGPWDGRWRIVVFDIPERVRIYRDLIRRKLIEAGAIRVQKSVWITIMNIRPLIDYLRNKVGLGDHIQLIEADYISNDHYFRKKFGLDTSINP